MQLATEASNNVSVIPRRLIGGLHEWRNERPTVPALDLVNLLLSEHAEDTQRETKTPWSLTTVCYWNSVDRSQSKQEPLRPPSRGRDRRKCDTAIG